MDGGTHEIHLKHIHKCKTGPVVVMFHGSIENGRIFYKGDTKGLGNFLADNGFHVYIVDSRGRGASRPAISSQSRFGQHESIVEDIPAILNYLTMRHQAKINVVCHSYGGVLFKSAFVRHQGFENRIGSIVCFGTKRCVRAPTLERYFKINLVWSRIVPRITKHFGYLDAKKLGIGDDSEPLQFVLDSIEWARREDWVDTIDQFDYKQHATTVQWPKIWHFSAKRDYSLGHVKDVERFIQECGLEDYRHSYLSKSTGNLVDYDHINMLTHPLAVDDHFPKLVAWLKQIEANQIA
jgi:predicted alpha/beta hydrolase